jgi:hypothetical protein
VGTSPPEQATYHPSASRELVTVLRLGRPLHRAGPAHRTTPALPQDAVAVIQAGAVALRFVGERVGAVPPMKARKARCLARSAAAEEGVLGLVPSRQPLLQPVTVAVAGFRLRQRRPPRLQLGLLLQAAGTFALSAPPPRQALVQGRGVERAATPPDRFKRPLVRGGRRELLLRGVAHGLLCHATAALDRAHDAPLQQQGGRARAPYARQ